MYLRDIVLSIEKAYKNAWELNSTDRQAKLVEFGRFTHCVVDLFVQTLRKRLATKSTAKVIVDLDDTICRPDEQSIRQGDPLLAFCWPLDLTDFNDRPASEKKRFILDILQDSLIWIATLKGWDNGSLATVYNEVLEQGICNHGYWKNGKSIISPDRRIKARMYYECELDRLRIYCVFYRGGDEEIGRKVVIDEPAFDAPLMCYWKDIKWASNSSLLLRTKDGRTIKCSMKDLEPVGGKNDGK